MDGALARLHGAHQQGGREERANREVIFNHDPDYVLSTLDSDPRLSCAKPKAASNTTRPSRRQPTQRPQDQSAAQKCAWSSFAFDVHHDAWKQDDKGIVYRDITDLTLYEVGPVTNPAYIQTTATMRSKELVQEHRKALSQMPMELRKQLQFQRTQE
jgi:hypothetical protein